MDTLKKWIATRVTELAGFEDDVLVEYVFNQLEEDPLDAKVMQMHLTGFMQKNARLFMKELWELLVSAQQNPSGIPTAILEEKKEQIRLEKVLGQCGVGW